MTPAQRERFDRLLQQVLDQLPAWLHELLEEVPLVVDDDPPPQVVRDLGRREARQLCGLYTGIPLTRKSVQHSGEMPEVIRLFRRGIISAARDEGSSDDGALLHQIRITVLHEIGHHFGLDEDDLREAGYG